MSPTFHTSAAEGEAKPALVPKLRFPEFRGAWEKKTLETLGYFTGGGTPSKDNAAYWTGEIPWISSSDLNEDSISQINITRFITKQAVQESATKLVPAKSILLISRVGVGKLAVSTFPLCTSQDFTNFTPTDADPLFLAYLLKSQKETLLSFNQGTSIKGFTKDNIASLRLGFPSPAEQQKIAECLSSVDELLAAQARKVDALKTHKKGLMQQLFPREGETQPRLRFPEFQNAGEWESKTLVDVCKMQAGKFVAASDIKELNAVDMFPCYGGNGLRGFTETYTHDGVYPLIGRQGALCGNVKLAKRRFHATEHAVVATPKRGIEVVYLYYLLDLLNLNRFATGQAQPGLSVDVLEKVPVTIPSDEHEQHRIATCLSSLDTLITSETQKLDTLKTHKRGLMQQLFGSSLLPV
jgi:type I restriction enzyme S subunit